MNTVGIDVSSEVFDACLRDAKGLRTKQFPNTPAGHRGSLQCFVLPIGKQLIDRFKQFSIARFAGSVPCLAQGGTGIIAAIQACIGERKLLQYQPGINVRFGCKRLKSISRFLELLDGIKRPGIKGTVYLFAAAAAANK